MEWPQSLLPYLKLYGYVLKGRKDWSSRDSLVKATDLHGASPFCKLHPANLASTRMVLIGIRVINAATNDR